MKEIIGRKIKQVSGILWKLTEVTASIKQWKFNKNTLGVLRVKAASSIARRWRMT